MTHRTAVSGGWSRSRVDNGWRQIAIAREAVFIGKAEEIGGPFGFGLQFRVFGLRQIDDLFVVAEHHGNQFGVLVEFQRFDDEGFELAGNQVRQIEGRDFFAAFGQEFFDAGIKGIAVRTGNPLDPFFFTDAVDFTLGAAFGIGDEDPVDPLGAGFGDLCAQRRRNLVGIDMPDGWQACQVDVVEIIGFRDSKNFTGKRAAGNDFANFGSICQPPWNKFMSRAFMHCLNRTPGYRHSYLSGKHDAQLPLCHHSLHGYRFSRSAGVLRQHDQGCR